MKVLEEIYPRSRNILFKEWQALQLSKIDTSVHAQDTL